MAIEMSTARPSAVLIEDASHRFNFRHVGMAGDDDVDAERGGIELQVLEIVQHEDG